MRKAKSFFKLCSLFLMPISVFIAVMSLMRLYSNFQWPLAITLLLVANVLALSTNIQNNILFLVFQGTFFLFLIAGPLLEGLSGNDYFNAFSEKIVEKTYLCYWIAAFVMWLYCFYRANAKCGFKINILRKNNYLTRTQCNDYVNLRHYSKLIFYFTCAAYFLVVIDKILFRQSFSLQSYYAEYDTNSNLPDLVVKIADCHLIALALFLATKPSKHEAKAPLVIFMLVSALTLLYGVRNVVILNAIFLLIYFVIRNNENGEIWLPKKTVIIGVLICPVLLILLQAFDAIRRSIAFNVLDIRELFSASLIKDFFVSQSVTTQILPNAIMHVSQLGGQPVPYTFGTVYTYLTQNMIVRFITGTAAFSSNSVESAMYGGNLGARLAYYMYKENFLSGTGMGGSYIAELFIDFSYVGVAIGMVIVCMLMNKLTKGVKSNSSPYVRAFVLVAIRWVVYMPRDCFLSWATQAFSFMNIIFVVMAVLLSRIRIPRLLKRAAVTLHTRGRDV